MVCTWTVARPVDPDDDSKGVEDVACARPAVAVFWRKNPKRRQPAEPLDLTYPSCKTHDTPARRRAAKDQGYEVDDL